MMSSTTVSQQHNPASSKNVVVNMRVTANSVQGHRKYMEDCYKIRFQRETQSSNNNSNEPQSNNDILFSYFAIFDGHGGKEASQYCKEKLYWRIIESDDFWSDNDSKVLNAIRNGFVKCHMDMWNELPNWPKTPSGLPSTSGSTATVLFIKKSKAYVGHVGDSGIVIGYTKTPNEPQWSNSPWYGKKLTRDHKPEDPIELKRIQSCGGSVMSKSGVNRVVWNRPILNSNTNQLNSRRTASFSNTNNAINTNTTNSTSSASSLNSALTPYEQNYLQNQKNVPTERVPFLAVARSLGDLWSYDTTHDEFIVSPVPDVFSFELDPKLHKCLILATDGLWNILRSNESVELVRQTDRETEKLVSKSAKKQQLNSTSVSQAQPFVNPSQRLVHTAMQRCCEKMIRADNTTCITIMLDQPPDFDEHEDDGLDRTSSDFRLSNNTMINNLLQNKTFDNFSCKLNDSDDEELDENDLSNFDDDNDTDRTYRRSRSRSSRSKKNHHSSSIDPNNESEFTTPSNDKRSRSLISLRRRHWSASSNRSASASSSNHLSSNNTNNRNYEQDARSSRKFVNADNRSQRRAFTNIGAHQQDNRRNTNTHNDYLNKSNSTNTISASRSKTSSSNVTSLKSSMKQNRTTTDLMSQSCYVQPKEKDGKHNKTLGEIKPNRYEKNKKSNLNTSSVSSMMGLNKFSKNLRKSFNDLYTMSRFTSSTSTSSKKGESEAGEVRHAVKHKLKDDAKENINETMKSKKLNDSSSSASESDRSGSKSAGSKYAKRLRRFKNSLIKTKNNLLNQKRKLFSSANNKNLNTSGLLNGKLKSVSSPQLNKIEPRTSKFKFLKQKESAKKDTLNNSTITKINNIDLNDIEDRDEDEVEYDELYNNQKLKQNENENDYDKINEDDGCMEDDVDLSSEVNENPNKTNQSIVNSMKSKLNYLKRNRSNKKVNDVVMQAQSMETVNSQHNKRPKFY